MAVVSESFGQRLRRLRVERGLTLDALAVEGACFAQLSRVERDQRLPPQRRGTIERLADKLDVTPRYLMNGEETTSMWKDELGIEVEGTKVVLDVKRKGFGIVLEADDASALAGALLGASICAATAGVRTELDKAMKRSRLEAPRLRIAEPPA